MFLKLLMSTFGVLAADALTPGVAIFGTDLPIFETDFLLLTSPPNFEIPLEAGLRVDFLADGFLLALTFDLTLMLARPDELPP
jgi:hypothetical protein